MATSRTMPTRGGKKWCPACEQWKWLSLFYTESRATDGKMAWCKGCAELYRIYKKRRRGYFPWSTRGSGTRHTVNTANLYPDTAVLLAKANAQIAARAPDIAAWRLKAGQLRERRKPLRPSAVSSEPAPVPSVAPTEPLYRISIRVFDTRRSRFRRQHRPKGLPKSGRTA